MIAFQVRKFEEIIIQSVLPYVETDRGIAPLDALGDRQLFDDLRIIRVIYVHGTHIYLYATSRFGGTKYKRIVVVVKQFQII
jgi:hypothetical protein